MHVVILNTEHTFNVRILSQRAQRSHKGTQRVPTVLEVPLRPLHNLCTLCDTKYFENQVLPGRGKKLFFILFFSIQCLVATAKDYPASMFGIRSDGITLNTRSIQFAIDYIHDQGGGRLIFDVGRFLTGSIHLKSDVTLHLKEGAVLLGSLNPLDYDKVGLTALILSHDQDNIGITGQGVIDGQGREVAGNVIEMVHKGLLKDLFRNDRPEVENRPML